MSNEMALQKYQEKQEKQEISYSLLLDAIDSDLTTISELIKNVQKRAECYDGYDFSEDINEAIRDLI